MPTSFFAGAIRSFPTRRNSTRTRRPPRARASSSATTTTIVGYIPLDGSPEHGLLVVNHEYTNEHLMFPGIVTIVEKEGKKTAEVAAADQKRVDIEMAAHGGTVAEIRKVDGKWQLVKDSPYNRRITATTEMAAHRTGGRQRAAAHERRPDRHEGASAR